MMMILVVLSSDHNFRFYKNFRVSGFQSFKVTAQIRYPNSDIQNLTSLTPNSKPLSLYVSQAIRFNKLLFWKPA